MKLLGLSKLQDNQAMLVNQQFREEEEEEEDNDNGEEYDEGNI